VDALAGRQRAAVRAAAQPLTRFVRFLTDEDLNPAVARIGRGLGHHGILIVPHSLPNHRPARIAHALKSWADRAIDLGECFLDFLSA
jgi:hypothetical protein